MLTLNQTHAGHALELAQRLADNSIHCIITSPPFYGLRDYKTAPVYWPEVSFHPMAGLPPITIPAQTCSLGLESDIWAYVGHLVALFRELRRALHPAGSLWLNLGDSYCGYKGDNYLKVKDTSNLQSKTQVPASHNIGTPHTIPLKPKDLMMIPARVALALQADGWYLRSDIIWLKRNAMPNSYKDRPTTSKEYFFLLSKSNRYFYDTEAVRAPHETIAKYPGWNLGNGDNRPPTGKTARNYEGAMQRVAKNNNAAANWNPAGRLRRESDWFFDSLRAILDDAQILLQDEEGEPLALTVNTSGYKAAHFATFPPRLIAPIIQAGCPERVCPECGTPWVRVTEKEKGDIEATDRPKAKGQAGYGSSSSTLSLSGNGSKEWAERGSKTTTVDFRPTCAHNLDPIPGVVLDPFIGSGTTARVAIEHRRQWLGFELNNQYAADLVTQRTNGVQIRLGV